MTNDTWQTGVEVKAGAAEGGGRGECGDVAAVFDFWGFVMVVVQLREVNGGWLDRWMVGRFHQLRLELISLIPFVFGRRM